MFSRLLEGNIMTKIVINKQHGGFGLSPKAQKRYLDLIGKECYFYLCNFENYTRIYTRIPMEDAESRLFVSTVTRDLGKKIDKIPNDAYWHDTNLERNDPSLIWIVNELGKESNGRFASLEIVEIPDDVEWEIDEYDGWETIHEKHRSWG